MIIFLGAGASKPFEIPDMKEFVDEFEKELEKKGSKEEIDIYQDIKDTLKRKHDLNIDLEAVLSVLYSLEESPADPFGYYLSSKLKECLKYTDTKKPSLDFELTKKLKKELIEFIKVRCSADPKKEETVIRVFDRLFGLCGTKADIFTTNYDTYIEEVYFKKKGISAVDGFSNEKWDPNVFDKDELPRLFKLHGSLNWYLTEKGELIKRDIILAKKLADGTAIEELMIYPVGNKEHYKKPYRELFNRLETELKSTKCCIVIGYSFGEVLGQNS